MQSFYYFCVEFLIILKTTVIIHTTTKMVKISKEAALAYHEAGRPGKIEESPPRLIVRKQTFRWHIRRASPTPVWKFSRTPTMPINIPTRAIWWLLSQTVQQYWVWAILVP